MAELFQKLLQKAFYIYGIECFKIIMKSTMGNVGHMKSYAGPLRCHPLPCLYYKIKGGKTTNESLVAVSFNVIFPVYIYILGATDRRKDIEGTDEKNDC